MRSLDIAATGMAAQEKNVETISNNIANVNTVGFKKSRTEFEDLLYSTEKESGAKSDNNTEFNVGNQTGSGSKVAAVRKILTQGSAKMTNQPYDLSIQGEGFFGILMPNGDIRYTRNGSFGVNSQNELVSKNGYKVFPGISIPSNTTHFNVGKNGSVQAYTQGSEEPTELGQIPVFTFVNATGLKATGGNLLAMTKGSGPAAQNIAGENKSGFIEQGMLETSNVSVMNEMTNLIKAQRAYEMNSKVMGVADQMLRTISNIR